MKTMLDYTNKIKPYFQGVAKVEPTTTAAAAHSKGERFYLNGTLVEATADIAVGATIAVNTNVKAADDVETQIAKLETIGNVSGNPKTVPYANVVSIKDGIAVNAKDVSIKIEPIQAGSGTPSPSNVRAISGRSEVTVTRAGKNLVEETIANANINGSGQIINDSSYDTHIAKVKKGIIYRVKVSGNPIVYAFFTNKPSISSTSYDGSRTVVDNVSSFTSPIDGYVAYRTPTGYSTPQVTIDMDDSYEAPNVNEYTINLGGTIYGGTLDVTTGVLTVDRIFKEYDGTETWSESYVPNVYLTDYPSGVSNDADANVSYGMCNAYVYANPNVSLETQDNVYKLGNSLNFRDTVHGTSLSDWTAYVTANHLQIIFPLATPQVIQLTPTQIRMLAGVNTVYANTGDTQLEYFYASVGNVGEVLGDVQEDVATLQKKATANVSVPTTVTTGLGVIQTIFETVDSLIPNIGDTCDGAITWGGHGNYKYSATKVGANVAKCMYFSDAYITVGTKAGTTYSGYLYAGTVLT